MWTNTTTRAKSIVVNTGCTCWHVWDSGYWKDLTSRMVVEFVLIVQSPWKGKVRIRAKWPITPELIPVSVAWSDLEYFYSPLDGMLVYRRVTPSVKFAGTHLYTWVDKGTSQEHNTMAPSGLEPGACFSKEPIILYRVFRETGPWSARSGDECTKHEVNAPPP